MHGEELCTIPKYKSEIIIHNRFITAPPWPLLRAVQQNWQLRLYGDQLQQTQVPPYILHSGVDTP